MVLVSELFGLVFSRDAFSWAFADMQNYFCFLCIGFDSCKRSVSHTGLNGSQAGCLGISLQVVLSSADLHGLWQRHLDVSTLVVS